MAAAERRAPSLASSWSTCCQALLARAQANPHLQSDLWQEYAKHVDKDGQLASDAFGALMHDRARVAKECVPQLFYAMAVHGRPTLSWDELRVGVMAMHEAHAGPWGELRCHYIFRYYDVDHDDRWTDREFAAAVFDIARAQVEAHAKATGSAAVVDAATAFELAKAEAAKFSLPSQRQLTFADLLWQVIQEPDPARRFRGTSLLWRLPASPAKVPPPTDPTQGVDAEASTPVRRPVPAPAPAPAPAIPAATPKERLSRLGSVDVIYYERDQDNTPVKRRDPVVVLAEGILDRLLTSKTAIPAGLRGDAAHVHSEGTTVPFRLCVPSDLLALSQRVTAMLLKEPPQATCKAPATLFGDVHGQLLDLLEWFDLLSVAAEMQRGQMSLCFLGDYVDRGCRSLEVVALLFALKVVYQQRVVLLRGNHESRTVNKVYGFFDECRVRIPELEANDAADLWGAINDVFDHLPLVAHTSSPTRRLLCVHGGIGTITSLPEALATVPRPLREVTSSPVATDLLWSDPSNANGIAPNAQRGISSSYGPDVVARFCERHNIHLIVRAHEVVSKGFAWQGPNDARQLLTLFSATNYCGVSNNSGGAATFSAEGKITLHSLAPKVRSWDNSPRSPPPSPR